MENTEIIVEPEWYEQFEWYERIALWWAIHYNNNPDRFILFMRKSEPGRWVLLIALTEFHRSKKIIGFDRMDKETREACEKRATEWAASEDEKVIRQLTKIVYFLNNLFEKYFT